MIEALFLACTLVLGAEWERVRAPYAFEWPRDHGAHPAYRTEWWYATGELRAENGRRFGVQFTIFRQGLERAAPSADRSRLHADDVLAAHLAIVDVGAKQLAFAERVRRAAAGLAGARTGDLDAWVEDWSIRRGAGDRVHVVAYDRERAIGIELDLVPRKPLVVHGAGGVSVKGPEPGNASAYMSWTRLATSGRITFDGETLEARGESWFDHEWGSSQLGAGVVGWDWFGLRLDDGRELMLYRLRDERGQATAASSATLVARDGSTRAFASSDLALDVLERGERYPAKWKLRIAAAALDVEIVAMVEDCEIDGRASTGVTYFEGPVTVSGSASGSGYAELTGYARSLAARF